MRREYPLPTLITRYRLARKQFIVLTRGESRGAWSRRERGERANSLPFGPRGRVWLR
jgi:hypothetical protein